MRLGQRGILWTALIAVGLVSLRAGAAPKVDADGTVHLPPIELPFSPIASPAAKSSFLRFRQTAQALDRDQRKRHSIAEVRQLYDDAARPAYERTKSLYPVVHSSSNLAGVSIDTYVPKEGVSDRNLHRVLINLPGGGFRVATPMTGAMASMPVASLGKITVISINYRQGPEFKFPAATQDVIAVYRALLERYSARNIGIYGCSAGGVLTGQAMAWIEKENLPAPGAIGIFCASVAGWEGGDSAILADPLAGLAAAAPRYANPAHASLSDVEYFSDANFDDPMVQPIRSPAILAKFPPTLIVTSTREVAYSPAVYTHTQLVKWGVDAELHVWEAMYHGFFTSDPDLPESREVWNVVTNFFDKHLGVD
jgi:epsilon-lactone hydrolase